MGGTGIFQEKVVRPLGGRAKGVGEAVGDLGIRETELGVITDLRSWAFYPPLSVSYATC